MRGDQGFQVCAIRSDCQRAGTTTTFVISDPIFLQSHRSRALTPAPSACCMWLTQAAGLSFRPQGISWDADMAHLCACSHVKASVSRRSTDSQQAPESKDFPTGLIGLLLNAYKIHENPAIVSTGL